MKYVLIIGDGMADDPLEQLGVAARARWQTARVPCQI